MGVHDGHRQRKKQQFAQHGLDGFADHEVLELLLYYAIPRRDTNEIAHRLLQKFGSLQDVINAPVEELEKVEGMGSNAAVFLALLPEVNRRINVRRGEEKIINSVETAGKFFMGLLCGERRELLYQVCVDAKGKVLQYKRLAAGTASMAPVSIREVVENALHTDATAVLLGHNHPSGIALPSEEDRRITLQIKDALATMGIALADHIIVADNDFVSMAASGMLL
ncbi:MAG: DNA repair protein RadC [Ruminococcaceae bacterium]|nr:DNA repair protein RadC [Oscillospiraceae bacterium]